MNEAAFMSIDDVLALVPGMTRGNLATMRFDRRGPKFYKPTARTVLYDRESVMQWLQDSAVETTPTGDPHRIASHNRKPNNTHPTNRKD